MTKVRVVLALQATLALAAAGVLALGLSVAAGAVSLQSPSPTQLAAACSRFALPHASLASVTALAVGSLAVAVVLLGARSLARQVRTTRRFLRSLTVTGGGPSGCVVFAADAPNAFCAGLLRPRVYVSDAALGILRPDELEAVLAHEAHHRRLRDPLRIALARCVGEGLFFLPIARRLVERYSTLAELAADRAAARGRGPEPLASALLAFDRAESAVVGVSPERVDHLLGKGPSWQVPLALLAWSVVVLAAVAAVTLRLHAGADDPALNLPLVAAQACMPVMALGPLLLGASAILAVHRVTHVSR